MNPTYWYCDECGRRLYEHEIGRRENDNWPICLEHELALEDIGPEPGDEDESAEEEDSEADND